MKFVFTSSKTGFEVSFLKYHDALQFRGYLSSKAISWAQENVMWTEEYSHARFNKDFSSAALYFNVLLEIQAMNPTLKKKQLLERVGSVAVDEPLSKSFLAEYQIWWHKSSLTKMEQKRVTAVAMDGHEKTACKCLESPPSHSGRPRKDGNVKGRYNGWFMLLDTDTGLIIGVTEMKEPENNDHVVSTLKESLPRLPNVNCVIYGRACRSLKTLEANKEFKKVKTWAVDKFHAAGHSKTCPCSYLGVPRIAKRLKVVNTSVCEQIFSWFRGYSLIFNNMAPTKHRFYVFLYARRRNIMVRRGDKAHLNPYSAHKKALKKVGLIKRPASTKYSCRWASSQCLSFEFDPRFQSRFAKFQIEKCRLELVIVNQQAWLCLQRKVCLQTTLCCIGLV